MPQSASGLTFYEEDFDTGVYQALRQQAALFNAASRGTIVLEPGARKGRKPKRTFFQELDSLIQTRDPSGTGTVAPVEVQNTEHGSIKVFITAPLKFRSQDWVDTGLSNQTGTRLYGTNYGNALARRYINSALAALVGGIQAVGAGAIHDFSGSGTMDYGQLNQGAGKFGDARQSLVGMAGYSKVFTDLLGQAFSSQQVAFQLGTSTIYNGSLPTMGLHIIQSDAPPLLESGSPDNYWTALLVPGAVTIKTGPSRQVFSFIAGDGDTTPENQTWLLSTETEFEIILKGVSWTGAGDNPNDAALATVGNWTQKTKAGGTEVKNGPGILLKSQ